MPTFRMEDLDSADWSSDLPPLDFESWQRDGKFKSIEQINSESLNEIKGVLKTGVKVSEIPRSVTISLTEYECMKNKIESLKQWIKDNSETAIMSKLKSVEKDRDRRLCEVRENLQLSDIKLKFSQERKFEAEKNYKIELDQKEGLLQEIELLRLKLAEKYKTKLIHKIAYPILIVVITYILLN